MAIFKLKKKKEPKIIFGLILNNLEGNLYNAISNRKLANEILKESLNIHPRRLIKTIEVVSATEEVHDLLVVYDAILDEKEEMKIRDSLEVKKFNFHIFNFNRKEIVDVENMIAAYSF